LAPKIPFNLDPIPAPSRHEPSPSANAMGGVVQLTALNPVRIGLKPGLIFLIRLVVPSFARKRLFGSCVSFIDQPPGALFDLTNPSKAPMGGAGGRQPLDARWLARKLESMSGDLLNAQRPIARGGKQIRDPPFNCARP